MSEWVAVRRDGDDSGRTGWPKGCLSGGRTEGRVGWGGFWETGLMSSELGVQVPRRALGCGWIHSGLSGAWDGWFVVDGGWCLVGDG